MSFIKTVESDIQTAGDFLNKKLLPFLVKAEAAAPEVEAVTQLVNPALSEIEVAGFALLKIAVQAVQAEESAVTAKGMNIQLDAQTVADLRAIAPAVQAVAAAAKKA